MRKVFLTFLGLGSYDKDQKKYVYRKTAYEWQGKKSKKTEFVQVAEQELLGWDYFDHIYIAATRKSLSTHFVNLNNQLSKCRGDIETILLKEEMTNDGQWEWFEQIFRKIESGDRLSVDLTHGYRSIPIVFSTAINFLQKTKKIKLEHVFYGAFVEKQEVTPLVNMSAFFDVNIWADAVTSLVDHADASDIAMAPSNTDSRQFSELSDKEFCTSCISVSNRFKSVDMNNIAPETTILLERIKVLKKDCSPESTILLELIHQKFTKLGNSMIGNPDRDGYTLHFFETQLEFTRMLLEHGLFMQAFTVMREWLSSLVMLHFEKEKMNSGKRRKRIQRYGGVFFNMLQYEQETWEIDPEKRQRIEPFFEELKETKIIQPLLDPNPLIAKQLSVYRNGFDHGWQGRSGIKQDMEKQGGFFLTILEKVFSRLTSVRLNFAGIQE